VGDLAVVTCAENILTAEDESDGAGFAHPGLVVATNVFRNDGDRWRVVLHHGSPVLSREKDA
jgi:ketosteroid isomerase-like protein